MLRESRETGSRESYAANDLRLFEQATMPHLDILYTYAFHMTGDQDLAGTLIEKTYVKAFAHWRTTRGDMEVRLWILKTLRSIMNRTQIMRGIRSAIATVRQKTRSSRNLQEPEMPGGGLPEWILSDIKNFSYGEIGEILECSVEEVRVLLHEARI